MASEYIVDVNEADFEYEVLSYSNNTPVVVDFWATWCVPCKTLSPLLERLAEEGRGSFRLAKVDVDENANLAIRYGVRSIPMVKGYKSGQVVSEFVGAQPEARVRDFIRGLAPNPSDLLVEKADSLMAQHQWNAAERAYRQAFEQVPSSTSALLGLSMALLAQGRVAEAEPIIRKFPASKEYATAQLLVPLVDAMLRLKQNPADGDDPLAAAYQNSLRLALRGNILSALDGLLDILHQNKNYQNGQARQVFLGLLEILGNDDPQTRQYRSELASLLF